MEAFYFLILLLSHLSWGQEATMIFAGDAMMHQRQLDAARQTDGSYSFSNCFSAVKPLIEGADYAVVNLETPLGGAPYTGYPCFCAPDSYLDALTNAGFDFFLAANNHCLDRQDSGVKRTISRFEKRHLPYCGIYYNPIARDSIMPRIIDVKGIKIAILNYTYGTNGFAEKSDIVIDRIDRQLIAHDIAKAKNKGADLTAVCVHWGQEYELLPRQSQRELAKFIHAQGADLVIGSHPHVIQPMEMDTVNHSITVYSLGNFISAMRTPDTRGGALVKVTLRKNLFQKPFVKSAEYKMVFVDPTDYSLKLSVSDVSGGWQRAANQFFSRARNIFDHHNINVAELR